MVSISSDNPPVFVISPHPYGVRRPPVFYAEEVTVDEGFGKIDSRSVFVSLITPVSLSMLFTLPYEAIKFCLALFLPETLILATPPVDWLIVVLMLHFLFLFLLIL